MRCLLSRVLAIIPARLGSERLPRKPLQLLHGRPLIEWVWKQVVPFKSVDHIVVATDSEEVAGVCYAFGADVELTLASHRSGTERCAEVASRENNLDYDVIVNIQGDEPFIAEEHVSRSIAQVLLGHDIGTVAAPVRTLAAWRDSAVVKVVRGDDDRALYFSRAPIPYLRGAEPTSYQLTTESYLRHVGIYAYTRPALLKWVELPETTLERIEKLEQLRPLAAGMSIGVGLVDDAAGGIDTPEDLRAAERMIAARSK